MEDHLTAILRGIHAVTGLLALVVAPLAMITRKSGQAHRAWGRLFFWSMAVVVVSAVLLSVFSTNWVMMMVAVFSFHLVASGYRSLYHKRLHEGQKPGFGDQLLQGTAGVVNGGLFLWGVIHLVLGHKNGMYWVFTVFGLVGLALVFSNLYRFYKRNHDKQEWLYGHMTGFLGGYIATVSAFSAVNMSFIQPQWLQWLWPTLVGSPLIAMWIRYYRRRFSKGRRARDLFMLKIR